MQNDTPSARPSECQSLPDFAPVPRKTRRHDGWTPKRQRIFIEALANSGSVKAAAMRAGMTTESAYQLRRAEGAEEFAAAWEQALAHGVRMLEDIALDRAIHGVEVPVYSYGKLVGSRIVYNDRLLMFILRNRAADRFSAGASAKRLNRGGQDGAYGWLGEMDEEAALEEVKAQMDLARTRILAMLEMAEAEVAAENAAARAGDDASAGQISRPR